MKHIVFLIVLLLPFLVKSAEWEVKVINKEGRSFRGLFKSDADKDNWISKRIALNSWGKPIRWVMESATSAEDRASALSTREILDDMSKPLYSSKANVQSCTNKDDCYNAIAPVCTIVDENQVCSTYCAGLDGDYTAYVASTYDHVYCAKIVGYEKMKEYQLPAEYTITTIDITTQAEEQKRIEKVRKDVAFGKKMVETFIARNRTLDMTIDQVKQLHQATSSIRAFLETGDIAFARSEINSLDESLITDDNKSYILGLIDGYLSN